MAQRFPFTPGLATRGLGLQVALSVKPKLSVPGVLGVTSGTLAPKWVLVSHLPFVPQRPPRTLCLFLLLPAPLPSLGLPPLSPRVRRL